MRKLPIALFFLLAVQQGLATPLVVARFDKGLVVGTNEVLADGAKVCKLHVAKHAVVLMSAPAPAGAHQGTVTAEQRMDRALSGQSLSTPNLTELLRSTAESAAREMLVSAGASHPATEAFVFRFVLVNVDDAGPSVSAFNLRLKNGEPVSFELEPIEKTVQVNELQDYSQQNVHMKHIAPSEDAAIEAVRQQLASDTRIQSATPTQAYQPPFSIVEMRNDGTMTLITPPGECSQEKINLAAGQ